MISTAVRHVAIRKAGAEVHSYAMDVRNFELGIYIPIEGHGFKVVSVGGTPLHCASFAGDLSEVKRLLCEGNYHPLMEDRTGALPLHYACASGLNLEIVKLLLTKEKSMLNHKTAIEQLPWEQDYQFTPLQVASYCGNLGIVEYLTGLDGCKLNSQTVQGNTALHFSCFTGHLDVTKCLIQHQADVNCTNKVFSSLLHCACYEGHLSTVKMLVEENSCDLNNQNIKNATPLYLACRMGRVEVAQYLIQRGCNINLTNILGNSPLYAACDDHIWPTSTTITDSKDMNYLGVVKLLLSNEQCDMNSQNESGNTPLHRACQNHYSVIVRLLTKKGCDINLKNKRNSAPIHQAYSYSRNYLDIVEFFINQQQCDLNIQDEDMNTPLHIACNKGHFEIARLLTEKGCDINLKNKQDNTPIKVAYIKGHLRLVLFLMNQKQWDPDTNPLIGTETPTPLHLACQCGYVDMVISYSDKCDLNSQINDDQNTPLHLACQEGHFEIARLLAEKGCDINLKNKQDNTPIKVAYIKGHLRLVLFLMNQKQWAPDTNPLRRTKTPTPLHLACQCGYVDMVISYSDKCDLNNQITDDQNTPLHLACQEGHLESVQYLLKKGCDINLKNKQCNSPMHVAYRNNHLDIVNVLISCEQCDLNSQNEDMNTLLHLACQKDHLEITKCLIEKGCNINLRNRSGDAPLHTAYGWRRTEVVKLLISHKCDVNAQGEYNNTLLHLACKCGDTDIAKLVIENGSDISIKDQLRNTPLHDACENGHLDIVKLFIYEEVCDLNSRNSRDKTPLSLACQYGYLEIVKALLATGKVDPTTRDRSGRTAAELTRDYNIVNEVSQYAKSKLEFEGQHPLGTFVQVFVTGNPSTGKTTLIEVLCREATQLMKIAPKQVRIISNVQSQTAGIIPREFHSKNFGSVVIYDFAGQSQYYSSHSAIVENAVLSSAPLFVVVVNLNDIHDLISERLSFWLSFIENHCAKAITPPHVIVVGSHKDKVLGKSNHSFEEKIPIVVKKSSLHFAGFVALDCRKLASRGLDKLRSIITTSCLALREGQSIYFGCHALYAFLLNKFKEKICCNVSSIASMIHENDILLPQTASGLVELLSAISDKGLIFLLKNCSNPGDSWVIFDKAILISEINGTMFAPENFKEHRDFATSTGVVPLSKIKAAFPKYNPEMITSFLTHLEFCQRIQDVVTLSMFDKTSEFQNLASQPSSSHLSPELAPHMTEPDSGEEIKEPSTPVLSKDVYQSTSIEPGNSPSHSSQVVAAENDNFESKTTEDSEWYFLFPALISTNRPNEDIWQSEVFEQYRCGWCFHCTQPRQFLTSRFLHVLLLRLAFSFALAPDSPPSEDSVVLTRRCSMWKNGIQWLSKTGVETIVEVPEPNRSVIVMMQCPNSKVISCARLRSAVIQKVLLVKKDCCPKVVVSEFVIHPSELAFPLEEVKKLHHFSLKDISTIVISNQPDETHVIDRTGKKSIAIEELLGFEPYLQIGKPGIRKLYNTNTASAIAKERHLMKAAKQVYTTMPAHLTYRNLREAFDSCSIFCGRNLLVSSKLAINETYIEFIALGQVV